MDIKSLDKKSTLKLVFLALIFMIITILGINISPWLIEHARNPEYIRDFLSGYGNIGFLVYILIQAIQVILVIIPVDFLSICGGFIYGIPIGFALTFMGLMLGSVIVFYISRLFGHEIVSKFIAIEKIEKISKILNSSKGTIGIFIICCIPLLPKDIMMYIAGLTPIKASRMFLIYGISRIPSTFIWVSIGANAYDKDYLGLGITIVIMLLMLFMVLLLGRYYHNKEKKLTH